MQTTTLFFDLGGVLLHNGWDTDQRARAVDRFGLDAADFEDRHREIVPGLETGRCTLDDYLRATVFHAPRPFGAVEFREFMLAQSEAFPGNLEVVDALAAGGRYLLATLNNESRELNEYRIARFGLQRRFTCFFSSSFLGYMKPDRRIYRAALEITQRAPAETVFVDDREQNLETARALGMRTLHFRGEEGPDALRRGLAGLGVETS
ncbi:MAG TPA: HAD family phosphatase [Longimicrobiaceae bacterium]|nr:HAD family phosphatase [Longimicrobiaceae bacterium]